MRAILRKALITALLGFAAMTGWYFARAANAPTEAAATEEPQIPYFCQYELELLRDLSRDSGSSTLTPKQEWASLALADCIANATEHPPMEKSSAALETLRVPPVTPRPTPTLEIGLRHAEVTSTGGRFFTVQDGLNVWAGFVDGNVVQLTAGWLRDPDEDWTQSTPQGVLKRRQGAIYAFINYGQKIMHMPTPSRNGAVHFLAACNLLLVLEAEDGTIFTYDAGALTYVENSAACPVPEQ